jgi:2',3'-cyclic-nucleotide 2'-phosphodiesterase (5'-nucleotidase family)
MARFAAVVKAERARALAENCHLICVHAGDTLSPSLLSSFDQGAHMVDLFNDVGLDAFVPGNHEFDFGKEAYFNRVSQARFPLAPPMKQRRAPRVPAILPSRRRYRWSLPTPKARARRGPIW